MREVNRDLLHTLSDRWCGLDYLLDDNNSDSYNSNNKSNSSKNNENACFM